VPTFVGVGACPSSEATAQSCTDVQDALAENGQFTLSLPAGSWEIAPFYENGPFGGAFLGRRQTVTILSNQTLVRNFTVPYENPARILGTVKVTGVPSNVAVQELSVLLCPNYAPFDGTTQSIACVDGFGEADFSGAHSADFEISGLPPGTWYIYPSYCTDDGCETNAHAGKLITLQSGDNSAINVKTPFVGVGSFGEAN
jgi:hypothetical protein